MEVQGQSAIVTGGASGLGEASARLLAKLGARVVVLDRQRELGSRVAESVGGEFVAADVCDAGEVGAAIAAARRLGPLRALVNCAGIGVIQRVLGRDGQPAALEDFESVVRVNLAGSFNCMRLAAAEMATNEPDKGGQRGAIVNTASVSAYEGMAGQVAYSASKAGVAGMTLPAARELSRHGIRVNAVSPGPFDTPILGEAEPLKSRFGASYVFPQRLGGPEEFASLVAELLTNDYMNGAVVRIDGAMRL
jgi:NAD(P)-dependent dehydrogenase (short-subunit alcohol dehydrogenase family)